jgi:hypothetical protein
MTIFGHDSIPTKDDWGDIDRYDLDASYAYKRFFGKTLDEVLSYFEGSVLAAVEDLYYMPPVPFRYYVFALKQFLLSDKTLNSKSECIEITGGASNFLCLVRDKLRDSPQEIIPIMGELMPAVEFVALHQELYCAAVDIYGSFPEQLYEIQQLYKAAMDNTVIPP